MPAFKKMPEPSSKKTSDDPQPGESKIPESWKTVQKSEVEVSPENEVVEKRPSISFIQPQKDYGSLDKLCAALCKAQALLHTLEKGSKGYGYKYASLAFTIEQSREALISNGLAISQLLGNAPNGNIQVTTLLIHISGQRLESVCSFPDIDIPMANLAQEAGGVASYIRRYAMQAILCMSSEDNDARRG